MQLGSLYNVYKLHSHCKRSYSRIQHYYIILLVATAKITKFLQNKQGLLGFSAKTVRF